MMLSNIVLIGFMGTGKTAVGKKLAVDLGLEFVDTDDLIEKREGRSVSEIFRDTGEEYFRRVEREVIAELAERKGLVVATGGGAVLNPDNVASLRKKGRWVCLRARPRTIMTRLSHHKDRPLLNKKNQQQEIKRLLSQRDPYYRQADLTVDTDRLTPAQAAMKIKNWLAGGISERVNVSLPHQAYEVEIGWGVLRFLGERLAGLGLGRRAAVVTNPLVRKLYATTVVSSLREGGFSTHLIQIPDGERYKTTRWVGHIYDELVRQRFGRGSVVVALGGGVIGDMAGFAAATYLRGIPYVQVPTTLAAQVDSSLGGKTGVNHRLGKNLIGAFYQPRLVYTDAQVLKTLNQREFVSGLAEVIKYGIIADEGFFDYLERQMDSILQLDPYHLLPAIKRSCEIKAGVVGEDEREGGRRRILNYGHTLGHALETVTGYRRYLHGEAISVGMVFAARLSYALGLCDRKSVERQVALLERIGLPVSLPRVKAEGMINAMSHDKKVVGGEIHFVLADRIGRVLIKPVDREAIRQVLGEWR